MPANAPRPRSTLVGAFSFSLLAPFAAVAQHWIPREDVPDRHVAVPRKPAPASDWPKYCGNLEMTGLAVDAFADPEGIPRLDLVWTRQLSGPIASAPSVADGRVYIGDWSGLLWALDRSSGAVLATADLGATDMPQCAPNPLGITSSPAIESGTVYVAGGDDSFYALDSRALGRLWQAKLGDNSASGGYYGWSSPAALHGRVLQGVSSNCDTPFVAGELVALDAVTGGRLDSARFVPEDLVGAGVWTSPAVDEARGFVYVTTGSADDLFDGYAFSVVRMSLDTLAIQDWWRLDPVEIEDSDWGSSPTLFADASGRLLVGAGQKNGRYYTFDRDSLSGGPVWATQIARGGGCPQCGQGTLSTAAFDGTRLYMGGGADPGTPDEEQGGCITALDPATGGVIWRRSFEAPVLAPVSAVESAVFATAGDQVLALDPATGRTIWSYTTKAWCYGGVAISGDRLFAGDLAGNLYAFGLVNGRKRPTQP